MVDHLFRHEYGKLVSLLSHRVGMRHIEMVEDAVQFALTAALDNWIREQIPKNPTAWLFRVASNRLVSELRSESRHNQLLQDNIEQLTEKVAELPQFYLSNELEDELLRMLFICCDHSIPIESQLVFALKTLCGFSINEIAIRLFSNEANIYKRLSRARHVLKNTAPPAFDLSSRDYIKRLPAINRVLYLMFTEGHLSSNVDFAIRKDLCEEAIRLTLILVNHSVGDKPECHALLSLMYLHLSRMGAREDEFGSLLLLEEQDRSLWDRGCIEQGLYWLASSAQGKCFSRYHAEAGVAAEHCLAPSFKETNWERIAECYLLLEQSTPSALHQLNRAIAVAQWKGAAAGLEILQAATPPGWLGLSYQWSAVLADLHFRTGNNELGERYSAEAIHFAPSSQICTLLKRRFTKSRGEGH
ncbi:RNA polymerase subunit sigma-70 [Shewanella sp. NR704-98]|uniref:RNA polymerase subunit sigma-70 n=1 Tax=Shewanella nanhaiensis TaxID=2864872 RepID=A0ABS7E9I6_9GAMM|nr:RNA polymerase subunit sigma-70 [Shewanella nanhaiensis]